MKISAWSAALVLAALSFTAGADATANPAKVGDASTGKTKAAICAACHGTDGNSVNPIWPKIAGQNTNYLERQIHAIKSGEGRNTAQAAAMRALVTNLSDQDVKDVAAYFSTQNGSTEEASAETTAIGQQLYRGGNAEAGIPACMGCHGPGGAGNGFAGYPKVAGQHAPYTVAQLNAYRTDERSTDRNDMMRTIAKKLSDAQIESLASYLSALH